MSKEHAIGAGEVTVVGAGICGTWTALLLAEAGLRVTVHERGGPDLASSTSHWAGGMVAPGCESDGAEPVVVRLGRRSLDLWRKHLPDVPMNGSLVVAHPRDRGDLDRFARQTVGHRTVGEAEIADLEPALAGRFHTGLLFPDEGHVEPRAVLPALRERLERHGGTIRFGSPLDPAEATGLVVDCRGIVARDAFPDLRGVKGETVQIETAEIALARPVRLMHPRWPIYVIPRPGHRFLIGATSVESEDVSGVALRSALELMSAAYALHPAFGEARIVEIGTALRPALRDNAPRIEARDGRIAVNGLYRHGFLLAPALAEIVAGYVTTGARDDEVMR
ncbi:FAD-dependent oxidoreductase [Enterovirga sp.]|uniref:FAD-dependent oxidoreductase n=1 Tax=Enterovirga sp. TaxID=2026350 RepID=UPI002CD6E0A2|nr:FAD-dependent oxidoreductase [Enterovirga sp.]HMO30267.1 FAD-dependent oxidoreductase [Enterovirga sp.]